MIKKKKSTIFKFVFILLILMLIGFVSLAAELFGNSQNTVQVEGENTQYLSVKKNVVEQTIINEGKITGIDLDVVSPCGSLYEDAKVTVELIQGETVYKQVVYARDIVSGLYHIEENVTKFESGAVCLRISGVDFPQNTDFFILLSDDLDSGLKNALYNGNDIGGPIVLQYSVVRLDKYFYHDLVLMCLLILVIVGISYLLAFRPEIVSYKQNLFICSFVLIFVYVALRNPLACFLAEPSSEMAYEFWYKAHTMSFGNNLMSLMSGESLVWTERILMYIADKIAPTKYVFVVAQLFEMMLICSLTSLFALSYFRKFFKDEVRLLVCFFIGALLLFPSAYYFWAVSYWASLFFIITAFMDMESMKRTTYVALLVITTILAVSRIYHILYVPIAIFMFLYIGKKRGKRFQIYCIVLGGASLFEVGYSMIFGGQGHLNGEFKLAKYAINTIYYQIQVLISYFCGENIKNELLANIIFGMVLIFVVALFVYAVIKNERYIACTLGCLGILSMGSIAINVSVCGMSDTVAFPHDYAGDINWMSCYFQDGDLHFSYSYFAVTGIFLVLLYYIRTRLQNREKNCQLISNAVVICVILHYALVNNYAFYLMRVVPTDWKSVSDVTMNDSYYISINVDYPFADISLVQNSVGYIYGVNEEGELNFWNIDRNPYMTDILYDVAEIGAVSDIANRDILTVTAKRANMNFTNPYIMVLYDEKGQELMRVAQSSEVTRYWMDFMLEEPLRGVYSVAFFDEQGNAMKICDGLQIGVVQY